MSPINEFAWSGGPGDSSSVAVISGGFDPIHPGHISLIEQASAYGELIIGLNSDAWLVRKKGFAFMSWIERATVLRSINNVSEVIEFNDDDETAISLLNKVKDTWPDRTIFFCNGGDRKKGNVPEAVVDGVRFEYDIGNEKITSSRRLFYDAQFKPSTTRWGDYRVIYSDEHVKIKLIQVSPGSCLSYQKHEDRGEIWFVKRGHGKVIINNVSIDKINHKSDVVLKLNPMDTYQVNPKMWHQLINDSKDTPLEILELQVGKKISEIAKASEGHK